MKMKFKLLIAIYIISSTLFLTNILFTFYNYSYRGYYTDKLINWIWLFLNLLVILIYYKKKVVKIYLTTLILFIALSIVPMGIPFSGIIYYFSTIDDYQQIKLNKNYRIERTRQQALSIPRIYIYKENGILEKIPTEHDIKIFLKKLIVIFLLLTIEKFQYSMQN
jgi:hypothetical protein